MLPGCDCTIHMHSTLATLRMRNRKSCTRMHLHRLALPPTTTALKLHVHPDDLRLKDHFKLAGTDKRRCCKLEDSLLDVLGLSYALQDLR